MVENIILTEAVYYILLSLNEPMHGYGLMKHIHELSHERVNLAPGTLYGALNTLLEKGWISVIDDDSQSRKKQYIITDIGENILKMELKRLKELVNNGDMILGRKKR